MTVSCLSDSSNSYIETLCFRSAEILAPFIASHFKLPPRRYVFRVQNFQNSSDPFRLRLRVILYTVGRSTDNSPFTAMDFTNKQEAQYQNSTVQCSSTY
jgi:hypothetical protein